MDIDPDIANWVLEFLLRQPLEDRTLNSLLRVLPLPKNNPNFTKSLLLKKLESGVSQNSISESTLELLEQLEEIEFRGGTETVSDAMKRAYCAVAVDCTVKLLRMGDGGGDNSKYEFFEAVKRVWRERIGRMLKEVEKGGLASDELRVWKDEIEAAVWEQSVCESVAKKSEGVKAAEAVNAYLREEREKMCPSFLELVADRVKDDEVLQGMLGMGSVNQVSGKEAASYMTAEVSRKEAASCPVDPATDVSGKEASACPVDPATDVSGREASSCPDRATDVSNASNEKQKGKIDLRNKLVGLRRSKGLASGNSRGAKIVEDSDSDEMEKGASYGSYNLPRSTEVKKVREALGSSSLELQAVVKDPLPDALQIAEAISDVVNKNRHRDPIEGNHVEPNLFIVDCAGVVQDSGCNVSNAPKPSLMERNDSAHTYEWDESIDGSQEEDPDCRRLIPLPSPRQINVSPLKRYEIKNLKRRERRKWSLLEEDTLRTGVQKYGKGNWKVILTAYRDIFEDRTEVDLKDKWRNLTRC